VHTLSPDLKKITLDIWENAIFRAARLQVEVLRLDKIHPDISGNKWFKLKYYFEKAVEENRKKLISFGGPYSNHLLALASAAHSYGFSSVGMVRGEEPERWSHTLLAAKELGMEIRFLPRMEYKRLKHGTPATVLNQINEGGLLIPEGGAGAEGIRGAEDIFEQIPPIKFSHICCAAGTGTTVAGLVNRAQPDQKIIGVSVLKGTKNDEPLDTASIKNPAGKRMLEMIHGEHFGGYAKYSKTLTEFMNRTFCESGIPTDMVYTGKLFFAVARMAAFGLLNKTLTRSGG